MTLANHLDPDKAAQTVEPHLRSKLIDPLLIYTFVIVSSKFLFDGNNGFLQLLKGKKDSAHRVNVK